MLYGIPLMWGPQNDVPAEWFLKWTFFWPQKNYETNQKAEKRVQLYTFFVKFSYRLIDIFQFFTKIGFLPNFLKFVEKNDSFQLRQKMDNFWEKKSPLIKYPKFYRKTQFFALKKSEGVNDCLKKVWPIAGFQPSACGFLTVLTLTHMNSTRRQRLCWPSARHGQYQEEK